MRMPSKKQAIPFSSRLLIFASVIVTFSVGISVSLFSPKSSSSLSSSSMPNLSSHKCSLNDTRPDFAPRFLSQSYAIDPQKNIWFVDGQSNSIHIIDSQKRHEFKLDTSIWNTWTVNSTDKDRGLYPKKFSDKELPNYNLWTDTKKNSIKKFLSINFFGPMRKKILLQVDYNPIDTFEVVKSSNTYNNYEIAFWIGTFDPTYANFKWQLAFVPPINVWDHNHPYGIGDYKTSDYVSRDFHFLVNHSQGEPNGDAFSLVACDDRFPNITNTNILQQSCNINPSHYSFFPTMSRMNSNPTKNFPLSLDTKRLLFDNNLNRFIYISNNISNKLPPPCFYNTLTEEGTNGSEKVLLYTDHGLFEASYVAKDNKYVFKNISIGQKYNKYTNFYGAYYLKDQLYVLAKDSPRNSPGNAALFSLTNNQPTRIFTIKKSQFANSNTMVMINNTLYLISASVSEGNGNSYNVANLPTNRKTIIGIVLLVVGVILLSGLLITWLYILFSKYQLSLYNKTKLFNETKIAALECNTDLSLRNSIDDEKQMFKP